MGRAIAALWRWIVETATRKYEPMDDFDVLREPVAPTDDTQ